MGRGGTSPLSSQPPCLLWACTFLKGCLLGLPSEVVSQSLHEMGVWFRSEPQILGQEGRGVSSPTQGLKDQSRRVCVTCLAPLVGDSG